MKSFHGVLSEADKDSVIDSYFDKIMLEVFSNDNYKDLKIVDLRNQARDHIGSYIDRLLSLDVKKSTNELLFCYEYFGAYDEILTSPRVDLIHIDELSQDTVHSYAYELSYQSVIMGFMVADNEYTQSNLDSLITEVLYEASLLR